MAAYHGTNENTVSDQGNNVMRIITFILAFTFVLSGISIAGTTDTLPNAGLFKFDTAPVAFDAPVLMASR